MMAYELINVSKIYKPGKIPVNALENLSLGIEKGDFIAIHGASGSGKSTLLNILGLIDPPTSGTMLLNGETVRFENEKILAVTRKDHLGFIFQDFNLIPTLTVFENVEYPLLKKIKLVNIRHEIVFHNLEKVGISDLSRRYPSQISGGQQQRVAIARAFAKNPTIVLADEPTANLDSRTGSMVLETMFEMNKENNTTFILASHDHEIIKLANRKIELQDGKIKYDSTK